MGIRFGNRKNPPNTTIIPPIHPYNLPDGIDAADIALRMPNAIKRLRDNKKAVIYITVITKNGIVNKYRMTKKAAIEEAQKCSRKGILIILAHADPIDTSPRTNHM